MPSDARRLVEAGAALTVEDSPQRIFPAEEYRRGIPGGGLPDRPRRLPGVGAGGRPRHPGEKGPAEPGELTDRHVYFGHAYKQQPGVAVLLRRFAAGAGADLEANAEGSAMARCVSRTLAPGVREILDGALPPGLNRAAETAERSEDRRGEVAKEGIPFTLRVDR